MGDMARPVGPGGAGPDGLVGLGLASPSFILIFFYSFCLFIFFYFSFIFSFSKILKWHPNKCYKLCHNHKQLSTKIKIVLKLFIILKAFIHIIAANFLECLNIL